MSSAELEMYKENILDHYKHPKNKHPLQDYTHSAAENNPLCGDEIVLYLKVSKGAIADASFEGQGCAISQAAASMFTEYLKGKRIDDLSIVEDKNVLTLLGIPISHTRLKCALLISKTLRGALNA